MIHGSVWRSVFCGNRIPTSAMLPSCWVFQSKVPLTMPSGVGRDRRPVSTGKGTCCYTKETCLKLVKIRSPASDCRAQFNGKAKSAVWRGGYHRYRGDVSIWHRSATNTPATDVSTDILGMPRFSTRAATLGRAGRCIQPARMGSASVAR